MYFMARRLLRKPPKNSRPGWRPRVLAALHYGIWQATSYLPHSRFLS